MDDVATSSGAATAPSVLDDYLEDLVRAAAAAGRERGALRRAAVVRIATIAALVCVALGVLVK